MEFHITTTLIFFLYTTVVLISTAVGQAFPPSSGQAFPPSPYDDTGYIRTSCETTRYPETCFESLSNYSRTIRNDPGRLATVAIYVALSNVTVMSNYVTNVSREINSVNTTETGAIRDCSSVFKDAVYEIKKSHKEIKSLGWTGESVRFQLSNVQTWMSAALTNEDTCVDGFENVGDSDMKADICGRVVVVKEVTSNALALVNSYADKLSV
ncbi:21 kDa protein-like [Rutidosis leptorrhynchoides]|uniref:21 kDa protein-like n=1 Tax=Rutidosis leptorrhynchoides TaxID=125765 RepID=UPI003A98D22D